jgi:hypothetical protein
MTSRWGNKRKKILGLIISALSFAVAAITAFYGQSYILSLLTGLSTGFVSGIAYNVFAKTNANWPVLTFSDMLSWVFIW